MVAIRGGVRWSFVAVLESGREPIADEAFGRFMQVVDPDGLVLQVQEHDPSLYT